MNGHVPDKAFSRFMTQAVGNDHGVFTRARWLHVVSYFIAEYFPDFLEYNPFEDPERFEYPYTYATLDFFAYIYQVHNAVEMMEHAEEKQMTFHDFKNWVNNYVLSYNEEQGQEIYSITRGRDYNFYISSANWSQYPLDDVLYEREQQKTQEAKTSGGKHKPVSD